MQHKKIWNKLRSAHSVVLSKVHGFHFFCIFEKSGKTKARQKYLRLYMRYNQAHMQAGKFR